MDIVTAETENEVLLGTTTSVPVLGMMLNQSSQTQKSTYCMIPLYEVQKQANLICDDRSQVGRFPLAGARSRPEEEAPGGEEGAGVTRACSLLKFMDSALKIYALYYE